MTNQQHPITPPDWLVEEWANAAAHEFDIATQAAQWGSDQELEACINYFHEYDTSWGEDSDLIAGLRAARRPKPPSLKAQALALLDKAEDPRWDINDFSIVRKALEQLND